MDREPRHAGVRESVAQGLRDDLGVRHVLRQAWQFAVQPYEGGERGRPLLEELAAVAVPPGAGLLDEVLRARQGGARRRAQRLVERDIDAVREGGRLRERAAEVRGAFPQARAVEVDHRVAVPCGRHRGRQFFPCGEDEPGLPQRQFEGQGAERLLKVVYLLRGRHSWCARRMHHVQAADHGIRVAFMHFQMGQGVPGDRPAARAPRPAAQGDLLGHRAGREEGGGLGAQDLGGAALQLAHDAVVVAVDVRPVVQVVRGGRLGQQAVQPLAERRDGGAAREDPLRSAPGRHPPCPR